MRIRVTVEYDTEETLDYEIDAWINGHVEFSDFVMAPNDDKNSILKIEEVEDPPAAKAKRAISAKSFTANWDGIDR